MIIQSSGDENNLFHKYMMKKVKNPLLIRISSDYRRKRNRSSSQKKRSAGGVGVGNSYANSNADLIAQENGTGGGDMLIFDNTFLIS